ncbi:hypothetical protein LZ32DRAFT_369501 [Colletotrichum eremochloae]|nr:hypothetical protein LZ32DRAFT_369501 [Colletotrichum eremochloae]
MGFRRPFRTSPSPSFWELCVPACWSGTSMRHANSRTWAGATGWQTNHTISKWGHPRWIPSLFLTAARPRPLVTTPREHQSLGDIPQVQILTQAAAWIGCHPRMTRPRPPASPQGTSPREQDELLLVRHPVETLQQ